MSKTHLNIENLPPSAQKQIFDFWEFLTMKYAKDVVDNTQNTMSADKEKILEHLNYLSSKIDKPSIKNPELWQRKIRKDRNLPGREA